MKVWALFDVVINCGGSYSDSLELRGIYTSKDKAEQAILEMRSEWHADWDFEIQEWPVV